MTCTLPLILVTLKGDNRHCLVVVSTTGKPPDRSIDPIEIVGQFELLDNEIDQSVASFSRGRDFADFLHESIARHGPTLPDLLAAAAGQDETYIYIFDGRTPTPEDVVPNEDIIGTFRVRHGVVTSESYQRFEHHRVYTKRGFFQLDEPLVQLILQDIETRCGAPRTDA